MKEEYTLEEMMIEDIDLAIAYLRGESSKPPEYIIGSLNRVKNHLRIKKRKGGES